MREFLNIVCEANAPAAASDDAYFYHGTSRNALGGIRYRGLVPGEGKRSRFGASYRLHSGGRVFLTSSESKAMWYAKDLAPSNPVVLRMLRSVAPDVAEDMEDTDCWFTSDTIPAEALEVLTARGWKPVTKNVVREAVSSTMEKFWFNVDTGELRSVAEEHADEESFLEGDGWVRGGLSHHDDNYYLSDVVMGHVTLEQALKRIALTAKWLLRNYSKANGLRYDIYAQNASTLKWGELDRRQMMAFIAEQTP